MDTMTTVVTEPGIYADMPDTVYHGDPVPAGSLSVSGAKKLLPPYCPAIYRYERDHGRAPKKEFDFGHAAHLEVLGVGPKLEVIDRPRWDTNEVKEQVAAIRAAGGIPLKRADYDAVQQMASAIRRHPLAMTLLNGDVRGTEQSAFWVDPDFGVWRRARFDRWTHLVSGRVVIIDYKTSESADPFTFQRTAANYGYHRQHAWYCDAARAVGVDDPAFVFIVQDKNPPYVVSVVQLDDEAQAVGAAQNRRALEIFRDCQQSGIWPGYTDEIATVALPKWATYQHEETFND